MAERAGRYQCANVGFPALKLPRHSGIIPAHCRSPSAVGFAPRSRATPGSLIGRRRSPLETRPRSVPLLSTPPAFLLLFRRTPARPPRGPA